MQILIHLLFYKIRSYLNKTDDYRSLHHSYDLKHNAYFLPTERTEISIMLESLENVCVH